MLDASLTCRVCGSSDLGKPISLREMMFLTGERFNYVRCGTCGCLQIAEEPADMARHYPAAYYSLDSRPATRKERLRNWLALNGPTPLFGRFAWFNRGDLRSVAGLDRDSAILDVGCGGGALISAMAGAGFRNVSGVDPFIPATINFPNGVTVRKADLSELRGRFDAVMLHHAFEHLWDQHGTLREVRRLLKPDGRVIIRIPTVESWQAETFGEHWAHLDPPRHFYLHTRKSISLVLERAGFAVRSILDDSNTFGVIGSQKAQLGKSTIDPVPLPIADAAARIKRERFNDMIAVHAVRA